MTSIRICFLGDSLIVGTNDYEFTGWPGRLAQRETAAGHDISIYNLGIRADTSDLIAARWRAECEVRLPDFHPGALVFSYGVNDMAILDGKIRVPLARSLKIARAMMSEAQDWKPTLWVGPQPCDDEQQPFRAGAGIEYGIEDLIEDALPVPAGTNTLAAELLALRHKQPALSHLAHYTSVEEAFVDFRRLVSAPLPVVVEIPL